MGGHTVAVPEQAIESLRQRFRGELILPTDPSYDAARRVWNGIIDRYPALVARTTGTADVITAIRFAREQALPLAVRAGGHSGPGFSTCDGGLVLDLSAMRGVRVDPIARTATVDGGALLGDLDHESQAFGLATTAGVVSHTGVAGLTLGGGLGRLQRAFGLTIDSLRAVDLVTAEGELVRASEKENEELFWGIRGAGPNFGVVTSLEFDLHPLGPQVSTALAVYLLEDGREVLERLVSLCRELPDEQIAAASLFTAGPTSPVPPELHGRKVILVASMHIAVDEGAAAAVRRVQELGKPVSRLDTPVPYLALQRLSDEVYAHGKRSYPKGLYTAAPDAALAASIVERFESAPTHCELSLFQMGGAIARVPDDATAFTGRSAAFFVGVEGNWDDPADDDQNSEWVRAATAALQPWALRGNYVNMTMESSEAVARHTYGDEKYERLVALKNRWDPSNLFRLNQNIAPTV